MAQETVESIIAKIKVVYPEVRRLPSGHESRVFYDCIRLVPADLARLGAEAVGGLSDDSYDLIVGRAYSGILFAASLARGKNVSILTLEEDIYGVGVSGQRILLVDDVIHTGLSLQHARRVISGEGGAVVGFACIVNRSGKAELSDLPIYAALHITSELDE